MTTTPNLALPLIAAAQAQKHVTHNEALLAVDALLQCAVNDKDLSSPPTSPANGDRYIVAAGAGGAWAGQAGAVAVWQDGAWTFRAPKPGFLAFVVDESLLYFYAATGWTPLPSALGAIQNLSRLGIGTNADGTNPVSAKINKALWAAKTVGEGGTGDLRYTMNKEATANVVSLLLQSGFSGRAEIGLTGDDNLHVKVSADGVAFAEALRIDRTTGGVDFKAAAYAAPAVAGGNQTVDLGGDPVAGLRKVVLSGSGSISSFGTSLKHGEKLLSFTSALTLVNGAALVLPGGANIVTSAGDHAVLTSDGSGNWTCRAYQRADGARARADIGAYGSGDSPTFAALTTTGNVDANGGFVSTHGVAGGLSGYQYLVGNGLRWRTSLDGSAESGGNAGSNWSLLAYGDAGSFLRTPLSINRATGDATFSGNATLGGALTSIGANFSGGTIKFATGFQAYIYNGDPWIDWAANSYMRFDRTNGRYAFYVTSSERLSIESGTLRPSADGGLTLGTSSFRWAQVYSTQAAISTSDQDEKNRAVDISDAELDAWGAVRQRAFTWLSSTSGRAHYGYIAQEVEAAYRVRGLDPAKFAVWCRDEVVAMARRTRTVPVRNGEEVSTTGPVDAEEEYEVEEKTGEVRYGLRYDLCHVIEAAWQRRRGDRIEARLAAIEATLAA